MQPEINILIKHYSDGGLQIECNFCHRIIVKVPRVGYKEKFLLIGEAVMDHDCDRKDGKY